MLRYVFDDAAQARRHLHIAEGHSLLFFGNASAPGIGGERVMLDLDLPSRGQHSLLRGKVHSRVAGSGLWLDFPDSGLLRRLEQPAAELPPRRQRRFGAELMLELHLLETDVRRVGRLLDVSLGGARIGGCRLPPATEVTVRLTLPGEALPRELGRARVLRAGDRDTAITFLRGDAQSRIAIAKLIEAIGAQWGRAPVMAHPRGCCGANGLLEPPLPRLRPRD
jgi:hypothetical protein